MTTYETPDIRVTHLCYSRHCCRISYSQTDLEMSDVGEEKQTRSPLPFTPPPPRPIQKPGRFYLLAKNNHLQSCYQTGYGTN